MRSRYISFASPGMNVSPVMLNGRKPGGITGTWRIISSLGWILFFLRPWMTFSRRTARGRAVFLRSRITSCCSRSSSSRSMVARAASMASGPVNFGSIAGAVWSVVVVTLKACHVAN